MILITRGSDWQIKQKLSSILNYARLALHETGSKNAEDVLVNARDLCELLECMKLDEEVVNGLRTHQRTSG